METTTLDPKSSPDTRYTALCTQRDRVGRCSYRHGRLTRPIGQHNETPGSVLPVTSQIMKPAFPPVKLC